MSSSKDEQVTITGSSKIQLGILAAIITAIVGAAVSWTRLDARVARIEEQLGNLVEEIRSERALYWLRTEQAYFEDALEGANPAIKVPKIGRTRGG